MKNRIEKIFDRCRKEKRAALILFNSCGYPDMESSERIIQGAIDSGADIIELGVPFSDPMADGAIIQKASQIALQNGATLKKVLAMAERLRLRNPDTGFILFSYFNVLLNYGLEALTEELERIGIDGILSVDLPFEEKEELEPLCHKRGLHLIPLVSPATTPQRVRLITSQTTGFVYYVAVRGITGVRSELPRELLARLSEISGLSPIPVVAGFGISSPATAHQIAQHARGIVVGSAGLRLLFGEKPLEERIADFKAFVQSLAESLCLDA
ncbi:MAG: tryptophan synthase subunit alpha [Limisphaerales bacterium]|jgi:tryptophan synthase alpha chain|nr:tryptophan synthase subunit alpha [Verrucomicrobiota bacterium]